MGNSVPLTTGYLLYTAEGPTRSYEGVPFNTLVEIGPEVNATDGRFPLYRPNLPGIFAITGATFQSYQGDGDPGLLIKDIADRRVETTGRYSPCTVELNETVYKHRDKSISIMVLSVMAPSSVENGLNADTQYGFLGRRRGFIGCFQGVGIQELTRLEAQMFSDDGALTSDSALHKRFFRDQIDLAVCRLLGLDINGIRASGLYFHDALVPYGQVAVGQAFDAAIEATILQLQERINQTVSNS